MLTDTVLKSTGCYTTTGNRRGTCMNPSMCFTYAELIIERDMSNICKNKIAHRSPIWKFAHTWDALAWVIPGIYPAYTRRPRGKRVYWVQLQKDAWWFVSWGKYLFRLYNTYAKSCSMFFAGRVGILCPDSARHGAAFCSMTGAGMWGTHPGACAECARWIIPDFIRE